jgi:VanZ family protein
MKKNISLFLKIVKGLFPGLVPVFVVLTIITLLFVNWYDPFVLIGPELLKNPDFSQEFSNWKKSGQLDNITIENYAIVKLNSSNPRSHTGITQTIDNPVRYKLLKLSGQIKTKDIKPGKRSWEKAWLLLSSYDENGKLLPLPRHVVQLIGTNKWQLYSKIFRIFPTAKQLEVSVLLFKATGIMWIKDLSLREVQQKGSVFYYRTGFIIAWSIFLTGLFVPYIINSYNRIWRLLVVVCLSAVIIGSLTFGEHKTDFLEAVNPIIQKMIQPQSEVTPSNINEIKGQNDKEQKKISLIIFKGGHFVFFAMLAFVLPLARDFNKSPSSLIPDLFMLAASTELMQNFITGRTPLLMDLLINLSGVIGGLLLAQVWLQINKNRLA